ncbi:unnamed protein product [Parascedosporium putredinis]|uniref:Uncharacterized protein n=1 Tax=Parascedosporium putredinis TaxID=1442378 RepID=A0A9P1H0B3_9PEZI|nr:unnamed protein product [Parascedosporium putredinis]CAI7992506.1 unnamed protein product [Parascedosporium putredinis]
MFLVELQSAVTCQRASQRPGRQRCPEKSFYKRYRESKASKSGAISDEDMLKYTGKTKAEINEWSKMAPGSRETNRRAASPPGPAVLAAWRRATDTEDGDGMPIPREISPQQQAPAADKKSEEEQK